MSRRGSIALARSQCVEIEGIRDDDEDIEGNLYGSVDIAVILSAEIVRLREYIVHLEFTINERDKVNKE